MNKQNLIKYLLAWLWLGLVSASCTHAATGAAPAPEGHTPPANHDDDVTDAEIISPEPADVADKANTSGAEIVAEPAEGSGPNTAAKPQKQG